ncbi:MAG: hypothetical protein ACFN3H_00225 [Spirochaetales bacterium]
MKKIAAVFIIIFLASSAAFAAALSYVYESSLSSVDFKEMPSVGQVFVDGSSNILAVRRIHDNVVIFDKLITLGPYYSGSSLKKRNPLNSLGFTGTSDYSFLRYSITTPLYPVSPLVIAGLSYGSRFTLRALVLAGFKVSVPLANLRYGGSTFIENGKLNAWAAAGVSVRKAVTFACSYGFSYRHNIGAFNWEIGTSRLCLLEKAAPWSPYIGIGVDF